MWSPQERCSQASHRRWMSASLPACSPYTCQSLRSLCDPRSPAARYPTSDPFRGTRGCEQDINTDRSSSFSSVSTLPINDSFRVQKLEPTDDLSCIEAAGIERRQRFKARTKHRYKPLYLNRRGVHTWLCAGQTCGSSGCGT